MRRLGTLTLKFAPAAALIAIVVSPVRAKADLTLFENDGWSVYTNGLVAAHYQLIKGDGDPSFFNGKPSSGGQILDEQVSTDQRDGTLTMSGIRSGFIGTQLGLGVNRQISQTVRVTSLLAINMNGVNNNRGQEFIKGVDYREAWAAVISPMGTVKFGRMFGLFASASAEVQVLAWRWGVGHPCVVNHSTISCGSTGAGPLYPGFDAAIRYTTPRIAGFELSVSIADPNVGFAMKISPYPRVDTDLNFDKTWGVGRLRLMGQSMFNRVGTSTPPSGMTPGTLKMNSIWGAMGAGILNLGPAVIAGGGWTGAGVGERIPLEANDPANPLSYDSALTLRLFRGFFGNAGLDFAGTTVTVGGGILYVRPTDVDNLPNMTAPSDVLKDQWEYHVTASHKFDAIVLNVEYMHWKSDWHFGETQQLNFMGGGINYVW